MGVKEVTDIVQAIAVVVVAVPAFRGLTTWRDKLIGQRRIELAEEALTLSYELQGVIEWVRHPFTFGEEGREREGRDLEPEGQRGAGDAIYSRISRLKDHEEHFARLRTVRMRFRAYFGEQAQDALATFAVTRNGIATSAAMLIRHAQEGEISQELQESLENDVWDTSTGDEPDEIHQRIDDAVAEIERVCSPILSKE